MSKRVPHIIFACAHGIGAGNVVQKEAIENHALKVVRDFPNKRNTLLETPSGRRVLMMLRGINSKQIRGLRQDFGSKAQELKPKEVERADLIICPYRLPDDFRAYGREDLIAPLTKAKEEGRHFLMPQFSDIGKDELGELRRKQEELLK